MAEFDAIRLMALCVAAAMMCAIIRTQRPELAMAISLGAGVAVLAALAHGVQSLRPQLEAMLAPLAASDSALRTAVLKAAGITALAELGSQICLDAGERAMAGRIRLVSRVAVIGLCLPLLSDIAASISQAFS